VSRGSSTISLTAVLEGVGGQPHAPAVLFPGKTRYPSYKGLGGPQGRSGRVSPPGFDPGPSSPWRVAIPTELSRSILVEDTCEIKS